MKLRKLLFLFAIAFFANKIYSQCSSGVPSTSIWGTIDDYTLGVTIDSDPWDIDTLKVTQGVDTSIVVQALFPKKQNITSPINGTATINSIEIQGVSNLPLGLSWRTDSVNASSNTYHPQNTNGRYGAITVCGSTFSAPGLKVVNVAIEGCGSISGISDCAAQPLQLYVLVLPGTGSGPVQMSPPLSCDSATVQFNTTLSSTDEILNPVSYSWQFHDGTTATGKPVSKFYGTPGSYPVKMTVEISEYYISAASTAFTGGWYPDIEELTAVQDPEPYLKIDGGNGWVSTGGAGSGRNKSWTGLNIPLTSDTIKIQAWDEDTNTPIIGSPDDNLGSVSVYVPFPYAGGQFGASNNNHASTVTLSIQVAETLVYWDTVKILPPSTVNPIVASNGFTICGGDSTELSLGATSYDLVKWFKDGVEILGATNSTLMVSDAGYYSAEVVETGSICPSLTDSAEIVVEVVNTPSIMVTANGGLYVDNPNSFDVQWYANGSGTAIPIPGATSDTLATFNPLNAPFTVSFISPLGCEALSAPFAVCVAGTSSADATSLGLGSTVTISHEDFYLNPGFDVAWAISTEADGPVTDMTSLQTAIDNGWVIPSSNDSGVVLNCGSLPDGVDNGNYYFTPISAEALVIDSIIHQPNIDSGCISDAQLCLDITATDGVLLVADSLIFTFPDGSTADLRDIVPANFQALIPDTINKALIDMLPTIVPGGSLCFPLTGLYSGDPNGTWSISALNVGTGSLTLTVPDIVSTVYADSCPIITQDQVITIPGFTVEISPNSSSSVSFTLPPLPSNFPTINSACNVIGSATMLSVNCPTGVSDVVDEGSLTLYPNPNNGSFTLKMDILKGSTVKYSVYDVAGRNIYKKDMGYQNGMIYENINLQNNLGTGFYVISIDIDGNLIQKHFIIK